MYLADEAENVANSSYTQFILKKQVTEHDYS